MKRILFATILGALAGCTVGDKVSQLSTGMTRAQVIGLMGKPVGDSTNGRDETLQYLSGPPLWPQGSQISSFQVMLRDERVIGYQVTPRQSSTAIVFFPTF
jgi:hypothetical protein